MREHIAQWTEQAEEARSSSEGEEDPVEDEDDEENDEEGDEEEKEEEEDPGSSDAYGWCEHYRQYRRLVVLFFLVFSKFLLDISSSRVKRWQTRFILS